METLDPQAVNLAKAIRQTESGGSFTAQGKSGEYGAYQFTEPTWDATAKKYGVNVPLKQATPEQQNEVAYRQIKEWKDAGNNVGQIASMWNAGEKHKDAYLDTSYTGVNKAGASYNVPAYAKSVATAYQTLKNGGHVSADPQNPSSTANQTPIQNPNTPDTYGAMFKASSNDTPVTAGLKSLGNVPSSFANLAGGLLGVLAHPIKTVEGIGSAVIGGVENLTGQNKGSPDQSQQTANAVGKAFMDRYGSLENAQRTATNDPAGFGADVLSIVTGGEGLLRKGADVADVVTGTNKVSGAVRSGIDTLNSGVQKVATPITSGIKGIARVPGRLAGETLGLETGAGYGPIKQAFHAGAQGGDANASFIQGLRGNSSPEELVSQARDALQQVRDSRSSTYQTMLESLGGDSKTYDISPVIKEVDTQLNNFGVLKNADGTLDFSRSKLRFNKSAQSDIQTIYDEMKGFGTKPGDRTALGVDKLKQAFYELDKPSSTVRSFTTAVSKATRDVLEKAPGYTKTMKNYADMSDKIDEIKKGLSLGDNAAIETSFKKLTGALRQNNPFRKQLVQELDEATGGQLLSKIAGQNLSSLMPQGLSKYADAGGAYALLHSGVGIVPLLGIAMTTSPRVVGEFVHALGLGARGTSAVMNVLNKMVVPAVVSGNANNRVNPSQSGLINMNPKPQSP